MRYQQSTKANDWKVVAQAHVDRKLLPRRHERGVVEASKGGVASGDAHGDSSSSVPRDPCMHLGSTRSAMRTPEGGWTAGTDGRCPNG